MKWASRSGESGFSLIETTIAVGLLGVSALGVAQLFLVAAKANIAAKGQTSTAILATQKMEQLRGLTWGYDPLQNGVPVSDTTTDLSVDPSSANGPGLSPTPAGTLTTNTPPYVDYLDAGGRWVGNGGTPVAGTAYIRRWAVDPLPTNPNGSLVLQVVVVPLNRELLKNSGQTGALRDETRLVTLRTRKAF